MNVDNFPYKKGVMAKEAAILEMSLPDNIRFANRKRIGL